MLYGTDITDSPLTALRLAAGRSLQHPEDLSHPVDVTLVTAERVDVGTEREAQVQRGPLQLSGPAAMITGYADGARFTAFSGLAIDAVGIVGLADALGIGQQPRVDFGNTFEWVVPGWPEDWASSSPS